MKDECDRLGSVCLATSGSKLEITWHSGAKAVNVLGTKQFNLDQIKGR